MFTGIVEAVSRVVAVEPLAHGVRIAVERPGTFADVEIGDSISVSGVCLTSLLTGSAGDRGARLLFEVSPETLRKSSLGSLQPGRRVNLERALAAGGRFGGHIVSGHVDARSRVLSIAREADFWTLTFEVEKEWARYVIEKGSIALDGISLTVAALRPGELDVAVIPHTYSETTLRDRRPGDPVNVEVDLLGKYVERLLLSRFGTLAVESRDDALLRLLGAS